ncbi:MULTISPECIES: hypothetical protein [Rhodomicrobium]|uniref:hypothetical protein n=1 Tax=Rhodomicrobium sp. R_RK_3 TaxID=2029567 RepID=UPI001FD991A3|nr:MULTISPECIES: hypothetical protein [Rhodomicrobium]
MDLVEDFFDLAEGFLDDGQQLRACMRQNQAIGIAVEETFAEEVFQTADMPAYGALRNAQALRADGKAETPADSLECTERIEGEPFPINHLASPAMSCCHETCFCTPPRPCSFHTTYPRIIAGRDAGDNCFFQMEA